MMDMIKSGIFFLMVFLGFVNPALGQCNYINSVYKSLNNSDYELMILEGDGTPSKSEVIVIKHKSNGNRAIFAVGCGTGGCYPYSLDSRHKDLTYNMKVYHFNKNLTATLNESGEIDSEYLFISELDNFDWYGNRELGEPYLGATLWKRKGCVN